MDNVLTNAYLNEQRFWLQIMGDHARFIFNSLAPTETNHVEEARSFIVIYDNLLDYARNSLTESQTAELNRDALETTRKFREYKLGLLSLTLESRLKVHISSTLFSHMLNELDEYMLTIGTLASGKLPLFNPIHYHILWLLDATGHTAGVGANLDEVEKDYLLKNKEYGKKFTDLYIKSINLREYMKTGKTEFPALSRLNIQSDEIMSSFFSFLEELRDQRLNGRVLGTLMPLQADHMAREECYYLTKLSQVASHVKKPDCDPERQRVET